MIPEIQTPECMLFRGHAMSMKYISLHFMDISWPMTINFGDQTFFMAMKVFSWVMN